MVLAMVGERSGLCSWISVDVCRVAVALGRMNVLVKAHFCERSCALDTLNFEHDVRAAGE